MRWLAIVLLLATLGVQTGCCCGSCGLCGSQPTTYAPAVAVPPSSYSMPPGLTAPPSGAVAVPPAMSTVPPAAAS